MTVAPVRRSAHPEADAGLRELLQPVLWDLVRRMGGHLTVQCGYQLDLCDDAGRPTGRIGGKLLRPELTLLSSAATGGRLAHALPAAAAIELLHNASLVHDDIMDGDRERRHRPTVWARFGVPSAILVGDGLIALGFEALAEGTDPATLPAVAGLAATLRRMGRGQDLDLRTPSDPRACLEMLTGKTCVLLGLACRLGAALSPAPPSWADHFEEFGTHLGVAFQLVDDVLDLWGCEATLGKPIGSDLRARKHSAPVVAALASGTQAGDRLAVLYAGPGPTDVTLMTTLVEEAGGRAWAEAEAERQVVAARAALDPLDLEPAAAASLLSLTEQVLIRTA